MPLAKIDVVEGRYDQGCLTKVSLMPSKPPWINTLRAPPEDLDQLIFEFPKRRFLHTPLFVGMHYTDDLIILDLTFIEGRPKEARLALLKDINSRVAAAAGISPKRPVDCALRGSRREFLLSARARPSAPTRFRANRNHMPLDLSSGASLTWPP